MINEIFACISILLIVLVVFNLIYYNIISSSTYLKLVNKTIYNLNKSYLYTMSFLGFIKIEKENGEPGMLKPKIVKNEKYYEQSEFRAKDIENYYSENFMSFDYKWIGDGAHRLGLKGDVLKGEFSTLLQGIHPKTDNILFKVKPVAWSAIDDTFNCPKSVSGAYNLGSKELADGIYQDFIEAQEEALKYMERLCYRKTHKNGKLISKYDIEFMGVRSVHHTSREVEDETKDLVRRPDFHLHGHNVLLRQVMTQNTGKKEICSHDNHSHFLYQVLVGTYFRAKLANKLRNRGAQIVHRDEEVQLTDANGKTHKTKIKSFEIKGFSDEFIDHFSGRRNQIYEIAKKTGKTSSIDRDNIAYNVRKPKSYKYEYSELKSIWEKEAKDLFGIDSNKIDEFFLKGGTIVNNINYKEYCRYAIRSSIKDNKLNDMNLKKRLLELEQTTGVDGLSMVNKMIKDGLIAKHPTKKYHYVVKMDLTTEIKMNDFHPNKENREYKRPVMKVKNEPTKAVILPSIHDIVVPTFVPLNPLELFNKPSPSNDLKGKIAKIRNVKSQSNKRNENKNDDGIKQENKVEQVDVSDLESQQRKQGITAEEYQRLENQIKDKIMAHHEKLKQNAIQADEQRLRDLNKPKNK